MPCPVGVIIRGVTEIAFRGKLTFPLLFLFYLSCTGFPLFLLCAFMKAHPFSLYVLMWREAAKTIVWSCTLHTSSSASTVQTGGRGRCCLESFGSALSAVNHSRLLYERGKRSVQQWSPGRTNPIRWKREGRRSGNKKSGKRGREIWKGGGVEGESGESKWTEMHLPR